MRLLPGGILAALAIAVVALPATGDKEEHRLVDEWTHPDFESRRFEKLLIIGIADLTEERKQFENKFVSHLRGQNKDGMTSYSIVPRLDRVEDRFAILETLKAEGVDGAITVRLVPLDDRSEEEWAAGWSEWTGSAPRVRGLIEETLPVPEKKAKRYGVEVALWSSPEWGLVWAARSDSYKRGQLEGAAAPFVRLTMAALREASLLR